MRRGIKCSAATLQRSFYPQNSRADSKLDFNCRKRRSVPAGTLWKTQSARVRYGRGMNTLQTKFPLYIPETAYFVGWQSNIVLQMSSLYHSLQTWFGSLACFGPRHFGLQLPWRHSKTPRLPLTSLPTIDLL